MITDVTRMYGGNVCIAGYAGYPLFLECVRPVFSLGGIREGWLCNRGIAAICPFAEVELEFCNKANVMSPHTEDYVVDDAVQPLRKRSLSVKERLSLLKELDDGFVSEIFGATIHQDHGYYVKSGEGCRSLGTIRSKQIDRVFCGLSPSGKPDYRITFSDGQQQYRLKATDLAFQYYVDKQNQTKPPEQVSREVGRILRSADNVFFRIGLARGWTEYPDRCYLQITGIYTFPDYLNGKCFADFV